jgi:glycosyltransferase involved in cell wall biosynthesis
MPVSDDRGLGQTEVAPRITVVTPSYNQGAFIEQTILSVIGQHYANLEYMIIDGGSTDGTVEIIHKYERHLSYWVSKADRGQSDAINKGFERSTGEIVCWLNSDDMYLPGALQYMATQLQVGKPQLVYGNCLKIAEGRGGASGSDVMRDRSIYELRLCDYVQQPSSAWTRAAWEVTGPLDITMTYAFDWDWFIRAERAGVGFRPCDRHLSVYRFHATHKTGVGGQARIAELASIYRAHAGVAYETLFWQCVRNKGMLGKVLAFIFHLGLVRREGAILRALLPTIFRGFSDIEIRSVLVMVPNLAPGHLRQKARTTRSEAK